MMVACRRMYEQKKMAVSGAEVPTTRTIEGGSLYSCCTWFSTEPAKRAARKTMNTCSPNNNKPRLLRRQRENVLTKAFKSVK